MKKLPIIRHIRYFYLWWRVCSFADKCAKMGIGMGYPNQADIDYLESIWKGEK